MKTLFYTLLASTVGFFGAGCDSAPEEETTSEDLAVRLTTPVPGDKIRFISSEDNPFLDTLEFQGITTIIDSVTYNYLPQRDQVFNISIVNSNVASLNAAILNTIGEPTALGSRFRELLERDEANFTEDEVLEIINTLNPSGTNLFVDNTDPTKIVSSSTRLYRMRITSNNGEKFRGSIGGIYIVEGNAFEVDFRSPTDEEFNTFRFLTNKYKIPFVTTNAKEEAVVERGTFLMELANVNNAPRE